MLLLRIANWITQKWSQTEWQKAQRNADILEMTASIQKNVTAAKASWTKASAMTKAQQDAELQAP